MIDASQAVTSQAVTEGTQVTDVTEVGVSNSGATDQPTLDDQLGFKPYVMAVAEFLMNEATKPPLAISIEGEWGSGKSSFMLQLEDALVESKKLAPNAIIQFNAWRHDKVESLWAAFAVQFAEQLRSKLTRSEQITGYIRLCCERFNKKDGLLDFLRASFLWGVYLACALIVPVLLYIHGPEWFKDHSIVQLAGSIAAGFGLLALTFKKLKDTVGSPLDIDLKKYIESPDYKSRIGFIEAFHQDLAKIIKAYGRGKIIVFIDDLDRCEIPKAADLIQGLNLMISDNSQLVFIVGMDREKVAAALASKYQNLLPYLSQMAISPDKTAAAEPSLGIEFGFSFIEKFIQIPFRVPQPKMEIKNFLARLTESTPKDQPDEPVRTEMENEKIRIVTQGDSPIIREIGDKVAPTLDYNPRRLKQFLNLFRLKTIIASNTGLFQGPNAVSLQQLAKWVVIILRWPLLLNDLDANPGLLKELQRLAIGPGGVPSDAAGAAPNASTAAFRRWQTRPNLIKFLAVGCIPGNPDYDPELNWSVELVDVSRLLQVSPLFKHRDPYQPISKEVEPEPAKEGGQIRRDSAKATKQASIKR